jgi:hypothetical protein
MEDGMAYLITIYEDGSNDNSTKVVSEDELFTFLQKQFEEEPEHREKFVVEQIGRVQLDLS